MVDISSYIGIQA